MEDGQNQENQVAQEAPSQLNPQSNVSFPTVGQPRKSGGSKTLLVIGILILVAILGFVIYKSASSKDETLVEPTPFDNLTNANTTTVTATATPSATSTAIATATPKAADKSKVLIEVQNGTGITGDAAYLQTQLSSLGYTNIKVGNAGSQSLTATEVTFSKTLPASTVDELTTKLKALYNTVTVKPAVTSTTDALIVTGLKKGATPKASVAPSATASGTPKATSTPTATPTPTQVH